MKTLILFAALALCISACCIIENQARYDRAMIKLESVHCPKCHYCSVTEIKRVCSDYKLGVGA